jgi:hypothetical protein
MPIHLAVTEVNGDDIIEHNDIQLMTTVNVQLSSDSVSDCASDSDAIIAETCASDSNDNESSQLTVTFGMGFLVVFVAF